MVEIRKFTPVDVPALQRAIDGDKFHPGEWRVEHFYDDPHDPEALKIPKEVSVIEDGGDPIAFVLYTREDIATLRISCVWGDGDDNARNARAIIFGLKDAVERARTSGFTAIVIETTHAKLATFFIRVMKMEQRGDQYYLRF